MDRQGAHDCRGYNYTCVPSGTSLALTCAILGIWVLYVLVWFHALLRAMRGLQKVPYKIYRMANMSIQVQASPSLHLLMAPERKQLQPAPVPSILDRGWAAQVVIAMKPPESLF